MTPKQLLDSIFQYAIQGKLVEQKIEDGSAEDLYAQIQLEKQKLISEGRIKREKPSDSITDDEIPFDIPDTWKWCRLKELCTKLVDGDHNPPDGIKQPTEYMMLSATNINCDSLVELNKVRYLTKDVFDIENERTKVAVNDIFFTSVGSMGRSCIYKGGYNICFQRSVSVITTLIPPEYLKLFLDSPFVQTFVRVNATGTAQKGFYLNQLGNLLIALPPLAEQERIVAKIEELRPYINRYAMAYDNLELFNTKFPEDMRKSIIQYAIQGKLVEQKSEDGSAEDLYTQIQQEKQKLIAEGKIKREKPSDSITDDEIPFDIPDTWKWCRLKELCTKLVDGDHNPPDGIKQPTEYMMLSATNINCDSLVELNKVRYLTKDVFDIENERTKVAVNDIFFTSVGSMGRSCIYKGGYNICFQRSVSVITTLILPEYLKLFLDSPFVQTFVRVNATGTAQKGFYLNQLANLLIALPPLAEQHRIVSKIEQMLPMCNKLNKEK